MSDVRMRIGLAIEKPLDDSFRAALTRLAERADVVSLGDGGTFDTVVRTNPSSAPWGERTTVWVDDAEIDPSSLARVVAVIAAPRVARRLRPRIEVPVVTLGPTEVHAGARPIGPFTRTRIRQARGLAGEPAIVRHDGTSWSWDGRTIPDAVATTAVGLASVVVAHTAAAAVLAAAWGAPVVTPVALGDELDLPAGSGRDSNPEVEAARLRADPSALARHAAACHAVFVRDHSPNRAVLLLEETVNSAGRTRYVHDYAQPLAYLGTPTDAVVRTRARAAVDSLRRHS